MQTYELQIRVEPKRVFREMLRTDEAIIRRYMLTLFTVRPECLIKLWAQEIIGMNIK
jgi:hypothetical protein